MKLSITAVDQKWSRIPRSEEAGELLVQNLKATNMVEAAQAVLIVAEIVARHKLEEYASCSINDNRIAIILSTEESKELPESFFQLADEINKELAPKSQLSSQIHEE